MAAGANRILGQFKEFFATEGGQARAFEESLSAAREKATNIVTKATQIVYQLRSRRVVVVLEANAPNKAARSERASALSPQAGQDDKTEEEQDRSNQERNGLDRGGPLAQRSEAGPSRDAKGAADTAADDQPNDGRSGSPAPVAGKKRAQHGASAPSKRAKGASSKASSDAGQLPLVPANGEDQNPPGAGVDQPSTAPPVPQTSGAEAPEQQGDAVQQRDAVMEDAPLRRGRSRKKEQARPPAPAPTRSTRQSKKQAAGSNPAMPPPAGPAEAADVQPGDVAEQRDPVAEAGPYTEPVGVETTAGEPNISQQTPQAEGLDKDVALAGPSSTAAPLPQHDAGAQDQPPPLEASGPPDAAPSAGPVEAAPAREHVGSDAPAPDDRAPGACGPATVAEAPAGAQALKGGRKQRKATDTSANTSDSAARSERSAAPAAEPRVTRSRRGGTRGTAAATEAPSSTSAPPAAAKPVRVKNTRLKRAIDEAQLGSPGLHRRSKQATEEEVGPGVPQADAASPHHEVKPLEADPTPVPEVGAPAAAIPDAGKADDPPEVSPAEHSPLPATQAGPFPDAVAPTEEAPQGLASDEPLSSPLPANQTQAPAQEVTVTQPLAAETATVAPQGCASPHELPPSPPCSRHEHEAALKQKVPTPQLQQLQEVPTQDTQHQELLPPSPSPARHEEAPPQQAELQPQAPVDPPLRSVAARVQQLQQAAAAASGSGCVPRAVSATVASLGAKHAARPVRLPICAAPSEPLTAAPGAEESKQPAQTQPSQAPAVPESRVSDATGPECSPPPTAAAEGATRPSVGDAFCFGVKPKEQSSPDMPHFGQPAEQATQDADADGAAENRLGEASDTAMRSPAAEVANGGGASPLALAPSPVPIPTELSPESSPGAQARSPSVAPDMAPYAVQEALEDAEAVEEAEALEEAEVLDDAEALEEAEVLVDAEALQVAEAHAVSVAAAEQPAAEEQPYPDARGRSLSLSLAIGPPPAEDPAEEEDQQLSPAGACVLASDEPASAAGVAAERQSPEPKQPAPAGFDEEAACEASAFGSPAHLEAQVPAEGEQGPEQLGDTATGGTLDSTGGAEDGRAASGTPEDVGTQPGSAAGEQPADATQEPAGAAPAAPDAAQPNKPKGGNLVSSIRSFLPQRTAPSPPPAAGKKTVRVRALEAAQAAKQKEEARQAERQARGAVDRQRVGPADTGAAPLAGSKPLAAAAATAAASGSASLRSTPPRPAVRPGMHGQDAPPSSALSKGRQIGAAALAPPPRTTPGRPAVKHDADAPTAATAAEGKAFDPASIGAAPLGSVKARAALFEQAKRVVPERKPVAAGAAGAQVAAPTYKAGALVRAALAAGDGEAASGAAGASQGGGAAPAAPTAMPPPSCSGASRAPAAAHANPGGETVADKHKRVELKRREEEERRRAELEARAKAKDDKLRMFEANKLQQRMAGGGAPAGRPGQPAVNPLAVHPAGKRQPPNNAGGTAGPSVKPEPHDAQRTGPVGPSFARTPAHKGAPVASSMVSPPIQMQVKLLSAVQPSSAFGTAADPVAHKAHAVPVQSTTGVHTASKPLVPKPPGGGQAPRPQPSGAAGPAASQRANAGAAFSTPCAVNQPELTDEDKRNVDAIKTSPYIGQVKPRTPATGKKPFTSYQISPYRSDSESDDDGSPRRAKKPIPEWAQGPRVMEALRAQSRLNPDKIFGECPKTIDIIKVFSDMPPPPPTDARGRPRRDYRRRGSSGNWDADA